MNKCHGILGFILGHKFRARYNEDESEGKWPFKEAVMEDQIIDVSGLIECIVNSTKSHKSNYVLDVCERCGEIIKHDEPKS